MSPARKNTGRRPPGHPDRRLPQNAPASADESPSRLSPSLTVAPATRVTPFGVADLPKALAKRVTIDEGSGCWRVGGYHDDDGYTYYAGTGAHRYVYTLLIGEIPSKHQIDHVRAHGCIWRDCINPNGHLEPVTPRENTMRGRSFAVANFLKTHCGTCGEPYDLFNCYVSPSGRRDCRACIRRRVREYRERHPEAVRETRRRRRRRLARLAEPGTPAPAELRRAA
jgi:hypothetical protein